MSSLQCPATLLLVRTDGAQGAPTDSLVGRVRGRRVASVWASPAAYALGTAELVARAVGCVVEQRTDLSPARPDEGDDELVARLREVLQEAADLHRGETVLLLTHGHLLEVAVPRLARMAVRPQPLPPAGIVEVEADEDWWCRAWDATQARDATQAGNADGAPAS